MLLSHSYHGRNDSFVMCLGALYRVGRLLVWRSAAIRQSIKFCKCFDRCSVMYSSVVVMERSIRANRSLHDVP